MKPTATLILAAAAAPLLLAGCDKLDLPFLPRSKAQLLVGTWDCTSPGTPGLATMTITFAKDGGLVFRLKGESSVGGMGFQMDVSARGAYALKDDRLSLHADDLDVASVKLNGETLDLETLGGKAAVSKQMAGNMKMSDATITEIDKSKLTMTSGSDNHVVTCER